MLLSFKGDKFPMSFTFATYFYYYYFYGKR